MPAEPARRRAAVLGHPIAHSLSPVLHLAAYGELGLDWTYERVDVTEEALPAFVAGLGPEWAGLSLTMPLKHAVLPLLDSYDDVVAATGAANTVLLGEGGRRGANTDVEGVVAVLDELAAGRGDAVVLGGGATARSTVAALARRGTARVTAYARRPGAADDLRATAEAVGVALEVRPWDQAGSGLNAGVVVSTVPRGVADALSGAVPARAGTLLDVVYDPWPTPLAGAWAAAGGAVGSGLDLLLHQAVAQVRLMTGRTPTVAVLRAALEAAAAAR
ncbi:MAG: shikimate dehydrogenase [Frankiales bacterium]|nr:shikimate dehydrogenase [Frankiales bacterium]